jgi:hypothetical protein
VTLRNGVAGKDKRVCASQRRQMSANGFHHSKAQERARRFGGGRIFFHHIYPSAGAPHPGLETAGLRQEAGYLCDRQSRWAQQEHNRRIDIATTVRRAAN